MPSKSSSKKKQLKSASSSPQISSSSPTPLKQSEPGKDDLHRCLDGAAFFFPGLIGNSAFIGRVTDVDLRPKGCAIWLSESSLVASSIAHNSIVSVCLASVSSSSNFPLCSLADECAKHFGIGCRTRTANASGNYFALATVSSSSKVLKDGVRLSSSLSSTLGCPASGRVAFVYPIKSQLMMEANGNGKLHGSSLSNLSLFNCKELYLELVPSSKESAKDGSVFSSRYGNEKISSPSTPLHCHSKLGFSGAGQLSSNNCDRERLDFVDVIEELGDESARKLLESWATSWISSRSLLCGNFVTLPILSKICIFQVLSGSGISIGSSIKCDLNTEPNGDLFSQALPDLLDQVDCAFTVNCATKVHLVSSLNPAFETPLRMSLPGLEHDSKNINANGEDDILKLGGLSKEYAILQDIIVSSSVRDALSRVGLRPTKGVLLHGPPGTGKTSLIRKCVKDNAVNLFTVNGPEIVSQYIGESEQALQEIFNSASRARPAVVFIDELDAIAPARRDGGEEMSQRMVATLLNLMDGMSRIDGLLVVAATNRPESIEPALRRPGRFDREMEIGVPSLNQRHDILLALLSSVEHNLFDMEIQKLAMSTHGFVGADLASLCNEAALVCLRRHANSKKSFDDHGLSQTSDLFEECCSALENSCPKDEKDMFVPDTESLSSGITNLSHSSDLQGESDIKKNGTSACGNILKVAFEDFEKARMKVRPSAMREVILEVPKVNWEDVGGQREVKMQLMEAVEWPQKHQDSFERIGTRPPAGVLLFGPPGCSKTLLARAVASEAGLNFLAVKGPELFSKWVGESEKAVRSLFAKARANAPSIIFFDEIDSLAAIRGKESDGVSVADRVMSQLLVELDGLQRRANVTVIAATNRPDKIDSALLRPGRFDRLLYVGPPSETDREDIFRIHLHNIPCSPDVCIKQLARLTEGCTGADISLICREAALAAIEESLDASEICMEHLKTAINQVLPSEIESYEELSEKFQRLVHCNGEGDGLNNELCLIGLNQNLFWTRWIPSYLRHLFLGFLSLWRLIYKHFEKY